MTSNFRKVAPRVLMLCAVLSGGQVLAQDYDTLVQDALRLRGQGDMAGAEVLLRQARDLAADPSEATALLGMTLAFQGRLDDASAIVEEGLRANGDHVGLLNARASIAWFRGDVTAAETANTRALSLQPDDVEALVLGGRIALARDNANLAQSRFLQALTLEPASVEANVGMYDVLSRLGNREVAMQYLDEAQALQPDYEEVVARRVALLRNDNLSGSQISVGYSHSTVDLAGFSDWYDRFVDYRHQFANGYGVNLHYEHDHRFDLHNDLYEVALTTPATSRIPLEIAAGFSPDHDFLPEHYLRLGASGVVRRSERLGTAVLVGGYQYSSFLNGDTHRVRLGVDYYLPGVDAWLSPAIGVVRDQDGKETFAWSLGGHWQLATTRVGVEYGEAPETENLLTIDSRTTTAYVRQQITRRVVAMLFFSRYARENSYTRESWSVNLQYLF